MCGNDFSTVMKESKIKGRKACLLGGEASILSSIYLVDTMAKQVDYEFSESAAGLWHMQGAREQSHTVFQATGPG